METLQEMPSAKSGEFWRIYAIVEEREPDAQVKIGKTKGDVEVRRRGLQGGNWRPLVVWRAIETLDGRQAEKIENQVHFWLSEYGLSGEWFDCTPEFAWHAVERALHLMHNPLDPTEEFLRGWNSARGPTLPGSPVHRTVAAHRAHAKRARQRGDLVGARARSEGRAAASALSRSHCRVQPLQLHASVGGGELPIGFDMFLVAGMLPGGDFLGQGLLVRDTSIETLTGQHAEFGLCHVQPAAVFGCVVPLEPLDEAARLGRGESFVE